jgi:hypothetical protein
LDGLYLSLGPVASLTWIEDTWNAGVGAEISVVGVREHEIPAAVGVAGGFVSYASRDGGRIWIEAETAFKRPLPLGVGVSVGVAAEVDPVRPPRWGLGATIWLFTGVIPYVRVGTVEEAGAFFEAGLMIKIPVKFRY